MSRCEELGQRVAEELEVLRVHAGRAEQVRARFLRSAAAVQPREPVLRSQTLAWSSGVVAVAAAVALLWTGMRLLRPRQEDAHGSSLRVAMGLPGESAPLGTLIGAPETESLPLQFSDGTRIDLAPRARARLVNVNAHGASVRLESGQANVDVVHRDASLWNVETGPFRVKVVGTRFRVRWDPARDWFELALEQGRVEISGCVFGDAFAVSAGQVVRASCRQGKMAKAGLKESALWDSLARPGAGDGFPALGADAFGEPAGSGLAEPTEVASEAASDSLAAPSTATQNPMLSKGGAGLGRPSSGWLGLAERGKYQQAYAAAMAEGFDVQCKTAGADALGLLGDSARYAGDAARAASAYRAVRARFPGTKRAAVAAFALGRLEFDGHGSYAAAAQWFRIYLKEQPAGPLTREARGRLMEATHRAGDFAEARRLAVAYLHAYPEGPHRDVAAQLAAGRPVSATGRPGAESRHD